MTESDARVAPEPSREKWNRRYTERGLQPFPDRPSEWLVENRALLTGPGPRRALDLACGDGRNALYLAQLGFDVIAVDISDVAITALRAAAAERGLAVDARRVDLEAEPLPPGAYDAITQFYYLERDLFGPLARALVPGGLLIVETFTVAHVEELGNQLDSRFLLEHNELLRSFPDLHVRHYREEVLERWGTSRGVASLVAERRANP